MSNHRTTTRTICKKRNDGSALIVAVLLLFVMTLMALGTIDVVGKDQQVAGYQSRKSMSLYAAEAGLAEILRTLEADGEPSLVATPIGDTGIFPHGQPTYQLDPLASNPVEDLGSAGIPGFTGNLGATNYQHHLYRVHVQGTAPGSVKTRLEVALKVFTANSAN